MSWIQTNTGRRFDLFSATEADISIVDIAGPLSRICRWGGQCNQHYSVAQHSLHVADLLERSGASARTQLVGLLHDAHEAYLGDIVTPLRERLYAEVSSDSPERMADGETAAMDELCARLQGEIFRALVPGLSTDGCETPAEARAWRRADRQALVTEARDLFDFPPVDDWTKYLDVKPDSRPLEIPLSCEFVERMFVKCYEALLYRAEGCE